MNDIDRQNVDLNLLKSLQALLDERQVSKAALKMNVSQSAMSHTLSRLRKIFNDPLFIRVNNKLEPTDKACSLEKKAKKLIHDFNALLDSHEVEISELQQTYTIQTHDYLAATYLTAPITSMQQQAPGVSFLIQHIDDKCYENLATGKTDLVIAAGLDASNHLSQSILYRDELVCLLDKKHPALAKWKAQTLYDYPHIKFSQLKDSHDPVHAYAKKHKGINRSIGLTVQSLQIQAAFIKGTDNIAFIPRLLAEQGASFYGLKAIDAPIPMPDLQIKAFWHKRNGSSLVQDWVIKHLSSTA